MPFFNIKLRQGASEYDLQEKPTADQQEQIKSALEQYQDGAQIMTEDGLVVVKDGEAVYYTRNRNVFKSNTWQAK